MELGNFNPFNPPAKPSCSHSPPDIDLPDVDFGVVSSLPDFPSPGYGYMSPQQLFMDPADVSAPNSTALTHMTTPTSTFEPSPVYSDWESPLFEVENDTGGNWSSLFPETSDASAVDQTPAVEPDTLEKQKPTSRKGSAAASPSARLSSVSGVSASRRRSKPLPPIHVSDAGDEKSMKRARNTLAARKSRARRQNHIEELEAHVKELEQKLEKTQQERDHYKQLYEAGAQ